jgi:signal peptidase I
MLEIVEDQIAELKKLWKNKRLLLHQGLNLAMIVFSALMIWKGLMFLTKSESPVVVVLSGSMEPAFQRGDILFLNNQANPIRVGGSAYNQIVALLLLMAFTPSTRRPFSLIDLRAGGRGRRLQN